MSAVASEQVAWTNKYLTEVIDERLLDIAQKMSRDVFYWVPGEHNTLIALDGVGRLSCRNVGRYAAEVIAEFAAYNGQLDFYKEYVLDKRHAEDHVPDQVQSMSPSSPDELEGCPNPDVLADGLRSLHEAFLGSLGRGASEPAVVLTLVDRLVS